MNSPEPFRVRHVFLLAVWFGLAYGLAEGILLCSLYEFSHWPMWNNGVAPQILWISPVINTALFLALGAGLAALSALLNRWPKAAGWTGPICLTVFAGAAVGGLILSPRSFTPLAGAAISVGVMFNVLRWSRKRMPLRFFARSLPVVLALCLVAGAYGEWLPRWREQRALAALPAAKPGLPNVLIIVLDTLRADHVSAYGYPRATTPNLDRIAAEGALFERAFSPSTNSPISHLGMMTGQFIGYSWFAPASRGQIRPLLAELLAEQGYANAACIGNYMWVTPKVGMHFGMARFDLYFHTWGDRFTRTYFGKMIGQVFRWYGGYYDDLGTKRAEVVNRQVLAWIDKAQQLQRPFYAFLNYMDVHDPYLAPPPYRTQFSGRVSRRGLLALHQGTRLKKNLTEEEAQLMRDAYDGELAYLDAQLGALRGELERRELWDNTLLIITADHGEAFGEENYFGHVAPVMRQEVVRVPLIVRFPPRIAAGTRVAAPASGRQIPATVADVLGLSRGSFDEKKSLLETAPNGGVTLPVLVENGRNFALVWNQWHLIRMHGKPERLYDLDRDPKELTDLAARPEAAATLLQMRSMLDELIQRIPTRGPEEDDPQQNP